MENPAEGPYDIDGRTVRLTQVDNGGRLTWKVIAADDDRLKGHIMVGYPNVTTKKTMWEHFTPGEQQAEGRPWPEADTWEDAVRALLARAP